MHVSRSSLLLLLLLAVATPLSAQTISGRVLDAATGAVVPQATVSALGANGRAAARARTGADGAFTLQLREPGSYRLQAERTGYRPTSTQAFPLADRETLEVDLRVSVEPLQIDPLTVTARRMPPRVPALDQRGYYRRQQFGRGTFLDRAEIERYHNMSVGQVLDRVPGTHLISGGVGREYIYFERGQGGTPSLRPGRSTRQVCLPALYVDGARMHYSNTRGGESDINQAVNPEQIEAIEVYRSAAEIPAEFNNSEAACGVIVIWTRMGR